MSFLFGQLALTTKKWSVCLQLPSYWLILARRSTHTSNKIQSDATSSIEMQVTFIIFASSHTPVIHYVNRRILNTSATDAAVLTLLHTTLLHIILSLLWTFMYYGLVTLLRFFVNFYITNTWT